MHIGEIDWGAIGTFVTKGIETAGQIQAQRVAQQNQALQAQIAMEQARMSNQLQLAQLSRGNAPITQNSGLGPYSPNVSKTVLGLNPLYLIGGAGALILLIILLKRK